MKPAITLPALPRVLLDWTLLPNRLSRAGSQLTHLEFNHVLHIARLRNVALDLTKSLLSSVKSCGHSVLLEPSDGQGLVFL